ncbi:MAG: metallophosphoesterase family protein [Actinomycetota bacterium]
MRTLRLGVIAALTAALVLSSVNAFAVDAGHRARRAPVIAAAGDIASAGSPGHGQQRTTSLLRSLRLTALLVLGDAQYEDGLYHEYLGSYDSTWGRFLRKTHPVPGNHDYRTGDADGYFRYFGRRAHGAHGGYYSFNLGRWHLIALNSSDGDGPSSAQLAWLRRNLRRNRDRCELAFWHHPRFSSGVNHGSDRAMAPYWEVLQPAGVDVVLNGHEHNYERFKKMHPGGGASPNGMREFVVGTGGKGGDYPFLSHPLRTSQVRLQGLGVLRMRLRPGAYSWQFVRPGGRILDRGSTSCHA